MAAVARVFRGCRFLMSPAKKPVAAAAGAQATKPKVNGGISKLMPVSDALRRFAGAGEVSCSGAVKLIWAHIKAKGLQNPADKREIIWLGTGTRLGCWR